MHRFVFGLTVILMIAVSCPWALAQVGRGNLWNGNRLVVR